MTRSLLAALGLLLLSACPSPVMRETRENEGAVCVLSQEQDQTWQTPQDFASGHEVFVRYYVDVCLSSSCDTDREATCTVALEGTVIHVESRAQWSSQSGPGGCTTDCGLLTATCRTPPLPAGTYTVRHGGEEVALTIPSQTDQAPCTSEPLF